MYTVRNIDNVEYWSKKETRGVEWVSIFLALGIGVASLLFSMSAHV